jgi:hypothetical protein
VPFVTSGESAVAGIDTAKVPARTSKRPGIMKNFFIENSLRRITSRPKLLQRMIA